MTGRLQCMPGCTKRRDECIDAGNAPRAWLFIGIGRFIFAALGSSQGIEGVVQLHGEMSGQVGGEISHAAGMIEGQVHIASLRRLFATFDHGVGIDCNDCATQSFDSPGSGTPATFTGCCINDGNRSRKDEILNRGGVGI